MALLKKKKKVSARRQQVRNNIATERFTKMAAAINSPYPMAILILLAFIAAALLILGMDTGRDDFYVSGFLAFKAWPQLLSLTVIITLIGGGAALYIHHYQLRIIQKTTRMFALASLFLLLLLITRVFSLFPNWGYFAVGTASACAISLTIAYNQRFAIGMSLFYILLACFAVENIATVELMLTMSAAVMAYCYSLSEIRTRSKLIEVSIFATIIVFITSAALGIIQDFHWKTYCLHAGYAALAAFVVGIFIQAFLPIIEQAFGIATSMTLLDYSDANQPLLKKLAMDAPGTFSHSLLIGSIAENAAEAIGANGLLCRVGAYYHDIGKINKPPYFVENQMGSASRHEQLSPAMSQLVIVGHVKDGVEIAREYGLPAVLRQFIETHHGTTLMEYFYHEAKKKADDKQTISESEFRYPGPKPKSKEAAIIMLADAVESAARSLADHTPAKVETLVHTIAMKRLQDGQFDECDLTLRELSRIEQSLSKSLAAHHHGRIAYPKSDAKPKTNGNGTGNTNSHVNENDNSGDNGSASKESSQPATEENTAAPQPAPQEDTNSEMNTPENIHIQFDCNIEDLDADLSRLEQLAKTVCHEFEVRNADIHIRITGDDGITEVHRKFLNSDTTTDVISFDLSDEFEDGRSLQYVVNAEMAHRQGQKRGHSTEAELALYITHGMLHHLGYDDADETQSARMHEKEDEILQKNGFGVIYHHDETPQTKENE